MRELGAISEAHRLKPVPSRIWYSHAMPQFAPNQMRFDPHRNFKFRVKWDDQYVAGISKVGALSRTTEVVEDQEGGDPTTSRKSPGRTVYDAITLERGLTRDLAFENWANSVWNLGDQAGSEGPPQEFRKDVIIEVYGEDDQLVRAYRCTDAGRCFIRFCLCLTPTPAPSLLRNCRLPMRAGSVTAVLSNPGSTEPGSAASVRRCRSEPRPNSRSARKRSLGHRRPY
jgi:phage tail-like protein